MGHAPPLNEELETEKDFATEAGLRAFAESFGRCLGGGEIVALVGTLGAGKTAFTQGLARGLGVPAQVPVTSPTFVLHRRYGGRCRLEHLDAYRLGSVGELEALDAGAIFESGAVVAVEWADKVADLLPRGAIWISIDITGVSSRRLRIRVPVAELPARTARALGELL